MIKDSTSLATNGLAGLMMDTPLTVTSIVERAEKLFGRREVVARTSAAVRRSSYCEVVARARLLGAALRDMGVRPGDRVATFSR